MEQWLIGLQKLIEGAQNPDGFAMRAASAGMEPGQIAQFLHGILPAPEQTRVTSQDEFAQMLGRAPMQIDITIPRPEAPAASPMLPQAGMQPPVQTMPQPAGPTEPGYRPGPMLPQAPQAPQSPWQVMNQEQVKGAFPAKEPPGLTAEQMAKLASLVPRGQAMSIPGAGSPGPGRTVELSQMQLPQTQRPSLAQILGGGR